MTNDVMDGAFIAGVSDHDMEPFRRAGCVLPFELLEDSAPTESKTEAERFCASVLISNLTFKAKFRN
ncbi:MAG: hypothetical protein WAV21_00885 [Minisyncoccia bacterium]